MTETSGRGRAVLVAGGTEFESRDAALFRAIAETGSVAKAASELGRSRPRALSRIETLEAAFGDLVDRQRGGTAGGGSRLTPTATELVARYERLQAAITAAAQVPETVLSGRVDAVSGELADVSTEIGTIRGLHDGVEPADEIQLRIGADALTLLDPRADPEPSATSARNRRAGVVSAVDHGETVGTVAVDIEGTMFHALVTEESVARLALQPGREVVLTWKATATRVTAV